MLTTHAGERADLMDMAAGALSGGARTLSRRRVTFALLGCAGICLPHAGRAQTDGDAGARVVAAASAIARSHVPYRTGGRDRGGFDCSGLVWYVHREVGVEVPRLAQQQSAAASPVALEELCPGDLLFFRLRGTQRVDHVGIYVGPGRLIHASIRRHAVTFARLDDSYFAQRVASAGRLWDRSGQPLPPAGPDEPALLF
jgi:hypothetical protein